MSEVILNKNKIIDLIDKLYFTQDLNTDELSFLLENCNLDSYNFDIKEYLFKKARITSQRYFGNKIYIRGLIEFTNYCKNDCYYCGIRRSNRQAQRYRLTIDDIISCCITGYSLGFRTFVLQGGEDFSYSDDDICRIINTIKSEYPDCAITLSIGERNYDSYLKFYKAGADRYLLRHETANPQHYNKLHPQNQTFSNRKTCLYNLKEIGYQVGTGFMLGSPHQTIEDIVSDMLFIKELEPQMIGIGPFIPHKDTPFFNMPSGTMEFTLLILAIIRLMLPNVLMPATTALATIHPEGREKGILAGANVIMPNLSPIQNREKYSLYDNKVYTGGEGCESIDELRRLVRNIDYEIVVDKGDFKPIKKIKET